MRSVPVGRPEPHREMEHHPDEYVYFMIRIVRPAAAEPSGAVSGVVERIGSGEKRSFASGEDLLRFMSGRDAPQASIPAGATPRNRPGPGPISGRS